MKTCVLILSAILIGCSDQGSSKAAMRERQNRALRDPMSYQPESFDETEISPGGIGDFKKDAFKRDVNSVFDP